MTTCRASKALKIERRHRTAGPRAVTAIRERREPNSSVAQVLGCNGVLGELAESLEKRDG
jgi:hypothetical protein